MEEIEIEAKIKEIEARFLEEVRRIERERDEKIKAIKKGVDQREIEALLQDFKK